MLPSARPSPRPAPVHANLAAVDATLAVARHDSIRQFLTYYRSLHPAGALPARSAFNPMAIPRLLPHLVLTEVEYPDDPQDRPRFRVKVAGAEVTAALGMALHGRYMDEIANTSEVTVRFPIESRHTVIDTGRLLYRRGKPRVRFSLDFANIELVHCPLAEDGATIDQIVSIFHYEGLAEAGVPHP
jgi:hypothetical protein